MLNSIDVKVLFLAVFLSASSAIMLGAYLSFELVALFLVIVFMSIYFWIGTKSLPKSSVSQAQFADSNYYLGFLLTLISLSASLIWVVLDESYLDNLVQLFGIALISTVYGLFIRIYIISFLPTTESNLENFDSLVSQKLGLINSLISENVNKNRHLSNLMDEKVTLYNIHTQKTLDHFSRSLTKTLDSNVDELEASILDINIKLRAVYQEQEKLMNRMSSDIQKKHTEFLTQADKVKEALENPQETP